MIRDGRRAAGMVVLVEGRSTGGERVPGYGFKPSASAAYQQTAIPPMLLNMNTDQVWFP